MAGVKIETDSAKLAGTLCEFTSEGLDNLGERLQSYKEAGIKFAKMRCALRVQTHTPSMHAMMYNAKLLARFASLCQQVGLPGMFTS